MSEEPLEQRIETHVRNVLEAMAPFSQCKSAPQYERALWEILWMIEGDEDEG